MKKLMLLILALIFAIGLSKGISQLSNTDKIIFLNLKLVNAKVYLENVKIVNGKLKRPKKVTLIKDHIYYKVFNKADKKLYQGVISDPSRVTYEYVDDQGQLQSKIVVSDSVNFSVRLPYDATIYKVKFNKIKEVSYRGVKMMNQTQSVGSVIINL